MNKVWAISIIASVLVLGTFGAVQDVYAPDDQPENLSLGGNGYNSDTNEFEIKVLVHLPKDADHRDYTVNASFVFFKEDGTPIRASANGIPVPAGVAEGGNNSSVHKIVAKIPYTPDADLEGEKVRVEFSAALVDSDGSEVVHRIKYSNITLKRG